jgi:uncharacterized protein YciI
MYYMIVSQDVENSLDKRLGARTEHICRLQELQNAARLLIAGPNPSIDSEDPGPAGYSGSLIVAEFDSLESAQTWADKDPYIVAGAYEKTVVKPFKKVFPNA